MLERYSETIIAWHRMPHSNSLFISSTSSFAFGTFSFTMQTTWVLTTRPKTHSQWSDIRARSFASTFTWREEFHMRQASSITLASITWQHSHILRAVMVNVYVALRTQMYWWHIYLCYLPWFCMFVQTFLCTFGIFRFYQCSKGIQTYNSGLFHEDIVFVWFWSAPTNLSYSTTDTGSYLGIGVCRPQFESLLLPLNQCMHVCVRSVDH